MGSAIGVVELDMGDFNSQFSSPWQGIAGIDGQVHQKPFDKPRISVDHGGEWCGFKNQVNAPADQPV
jgi:hypothetical protein